MRIEDVVSELIARAQTRLPKDVTDGLRKAYCRERNPLARLQLEVILENIEFAEKRKIPMCQDTGVLVFYADVGSKAGVSPTELKSSILSGVRKATRDVPLRPNIVHPLSRENSGDNTGFRNPIVHFDFIKGANYVDLTVLPKGAGSENMSALSMLTPSQGVDGVKAFIVEVVRSAGGRPCPPVIVGVGIGGTADYAIALSKKALLRPLSSASADKDAAKIERKLLAGINGLGVGPMGLGGDTTALGVLVEVAGCHTASLPVAVNIQCWAARVAKVRVRGNRVEWLR
jgi:fumarate hydratase subunit alpha